MYKNTFKKPKSQLYFSSLSLTRKTQDWITHNFSLIRLYFSSYFSSYTTLGLFGITLLLPHITRAHTSARTHTHIYRYTYVHTCVCVCYFIKLARGTPNTTCIQSITMTELGLVGLYGLVEKFKPHFTPH